MEEYPVISEKFIEVERLFAAKNPRLLRLLPKIFFTWLKRILHQEEVNAAIFKHRDKFGLDFVEAILLEFGVRIEVVDPNGEKESVHDISPCLRSFDRMENIVPANGRFIFASNHPLGGLDGLALIHVIGKVRKDLVFPVNDLLMNLPGLKSLFIPINKHGKNTENIAIIDETFSSDKTILFFPAGLVSRKQRGGEIRDLEWKKTFISKARKYQRDIFPVFISGKNSGFFYSLANWRRRVGIKANIEMLFLVDEMVKQKGKTLQLVFGNPVPHALFDKASNDAQWAAKVKEQVYQLKPDGTHHRTDRR